MTRHLMQLLLYSLFTCFVACSSGGVSISNQESITPPADSIPPTVISVAPSSGSINVGINSSISIFFSEAMDASSVSPSNITVSGVSAATVTLSDDKRNAVFIPFSPLASSSTYIVTITTGVKDLAGNAMTNNYEFSFTTGATSDTTPPTVVSTSPSNNTAVDISTPISVSFSEGIDPLTINSDTFLVNDGSSNIAGSLILSSQTATFTPTSMLTYNIPYSATITIGVKDLAGNAMAAPYIWNFTLVAVILTWEAPTTNVDGSPLDDLAGYKIYYGTTSRNYSVLIDVPLGSTGLICNLVNSKTECSFGVAQTSGTYFFSVTAYDTSENESLYSNELIKIVP